MIKNYFKIAIRNLIRNRSFAAINIIGLTVGIASCLLIFLLIRFELSFDNFHNNKDRIYRVVSEQYKPDGVHYTGGVPFPVGKTLRIDFPQLTKVGSILKTGGQITVLENLGVTEKKFREENIYYAEPQIFEIFNFPLLAGNIQTALAEPNSVILAQSAADKYFGDWRNAIGKTIRHTNKYDYKVTGVMKDIPHNSDFPLEIVLSYASLKNTNYLNNLEDWVSIFGDAHTYVVLPSGLSRDKFNSDLRTFVNKHKPQEYANEILVLQPLSEVHVDARFENYSGRNFSRELVTALSLIAGFLLVIACVNFINLATAQAIKRSREIGVRKVLGSNRHQIGLQFLSETILITVFASILAVVLTEAFLPYLNGFLQRQISFNIFGSFEIMGFLAGITLIVILLSGFYPAIILSRFSPIAALKNKFTSKAVGGISLRRGLVVLQFFIAHILIIGMLVLVMQMDYFKNVSLGFNKDAVVFVPIPNDSLSGKKIDFFKQQLLKHPEIKTVSFSTFSPADDFSWKSNFKFDNSIKNSDFSADLKWADAEYFNTFNIELISGRCYTQSDSVRELVVNETFAKKLGFKNPSDVIGKEVSFWDGEIRAPIVGVIKDFHPGTLHSNITPVILGTWKEVYQQVNIKIEARRVHAALAAIERTWNESYPEYLYEYQFLDKKIEDFYKQENQLSQLYKIFAGIAIFISCLGLYGLVSFMVIQRTKEVGMRKILGATSINIVYLFSKEYLILICIALLAAAPIAYFLIKNWLENFAFRIEIGFGYFLATLLITILFASLTVSYKAIKAASANPIESMKYE